MKNYVLVGGAKMKSSATKYLFIDFGSFRPISSKFEPIWIHMGPYRPEMGPYGSICDHGPGGGADEPWT